MAYDGRYVASEGKFKNHAFAALSSRFNDRQEFEKFYATLSTPEQKDGFLRVSSFYLFLVKEGDWRIKVPGYDEVIDYMTNSIKLVALFSLIESLNDLKYQEFSDWLSSQPPTEVFPIADNENLRRLHAKYKDSFGAIRQCVSFFDGLPAKQKTQLCEAIQPGRKPMGSIKKLAQYLYQLRSKFVHEAKYALQITEKPMDFFEGKKKISTTLKVSKLLDAFEEGLLANFGYKK